MTTTRLFGIGGVLLLVGSGCVSTAQFERKLVETQQERRDADIALRQQIAQLEQELQATREQLQESLADEACTRQDEDKSLAKRSADAQGTLSNRIETATSLLAKELVGLNAAVSDLSREQQDRFDAESAARNKGDRDLRARLADLDQRLAARVDRAQALADKRSVEWAEAQDQLRADVKRKLDDVTARHLAAETELRDALTESESKLLATLTDRFALASAELSALHDQVASVRSDLSAARDELGSLTEGLARVDTRLKSRLRDEAAVRANEDDCLFARVEAYQTAQAAYRTALQEDLDRLTADIAQEIMAIKTDLIAARQAQAELAEAIASAAAVAAPPATPSTNALEAALSLAPSPPAASASHTTTTPTPTDSGAVARPCESLAAPRAASKFDPAPTVFDEPEDARLEPPMDQSTPSRPAQAAP